MAQSTYQILSFVTFYVQSDTFREAEYGLYHHTCAISQLEKSEQSHSFCHQSHNVHFNFKNVNVYTKYGFSHLSFLFGFKRLTSLFFSTLKQELLKCLCT